MERAEATARILSAARGEQWQGGKVCIFEMQDGQAVCTGKEDAPTLKDALCVCVARTKEDVKTFDAMAGEELLQVAGIV